VHDRDDAFEDFTIELLEVEEFAGHVVASMRQRGRGEGERGGGGGPHHARLDPGERRAIRLQSSAQREDAIRY
jgi:hypothetical protein